MKRGILMTASLAVILLGVSQLKADIQGYQIDVTTGYGSGDPFGNLLGGGSPNPDTGFVQITNSGTTTFTGTLATVALSGFGGNDSFLSGSLTLNPGDSRSIAIGSESSNQGGYNGTFGSLQPGVQIVINGLINGSEAVNLSVNDADIHSGVPQTNPFGVLVDSYVLQGGDPFGRDTTDGFETAQAQGNFRFFEPAAAVPEPSRLVGLFGMAGIGLIGLKWRRSRSAA